MVEIFFFWCVVSLLIGAAFGIHHILEQSVGVWRQASAIILAIEENVTKNDKIRSFKLTVLVQPKGSRNFVAEIKCRGAAGTIGDLKAGKELLVEYNSSYTHIVNSI